MWASPVRVPVCFLSTVLLVPLPSIMPGEAADDPRAWSPASHVGDTDGVPCPASVWLSPSH